MKKEVYKINDDGYVIDKYVVNCDSEGNVIDKLLPNTITKSIPDGLFLAKWNGESWVEGMSKDEINAIRNAPKEPTELEKQQEIINIVGQELAQLKLQLMML